MTILYDVKQAHAVVMELWGKIKTALESGKQLEIIVKPVSKSREQEKKYHAMINEIATQASHMGAKWSSDDWKRLLVDKFIRDTGNVNAPVVPNLDQSGIVQLGFQTRNFTKEQGAEFIEFLHQWSADHGIELSE